VEPGPLPPHERAWRHPSELAPTRSTLDDGRRHPWAPAAVVGALAVAVVVTLAAAMTPRPTDAPTAIEATTMPPFVTRSATATVAPEPEAAGRPSTIQLAAAIAFPQAVAATPPSDALTVSPRAPSPADTVVVLTSDEVYRTAWHDVTFCDVDDGVVTNADGELVALIREGVITVVAVAGRVSPISGASGAVAGDD
jgi:hypothetical protein